jgi:DNA repair photolyase
MSPSKLADYTLNPYAGCEHGCVYCYARFVTRFSHPREEWGSFVDVKINAPELVAKEVSRKKVGKVYISSVSDGWQPLERRHQLTRQCLETLLERGYPLFLQTKSALIERDFDLIRGHPNIELGTTLTTLDAEIAALFEPKASSPAERIRVLNHARGIGVSTFVFLGPLLPFISDRGRGLRELLETVLKIDPDYFLVDRLNLRFGMWPALSAALAKYNPELVEAYKQILFQRETSQRYTFELGDRIAAEVGKLGLTEKMRLCF